jgi:hypothetical protein
MVRIDVEVTDIERVGTGGGERAHLLIEEKTHLKPLVDVEPGTEPPRRGVLRIDRVVDVAVARQDRGVGLDAIRQRPPEETHDLDSLSEGRRRRPENAH